MEPEDESLLFQLSSTTELSYFSDKSPTDQLIYFKKEFANMERRSHQLYKTINKLEKERDALKKKCI